MAEKEYIEREVLLETLNGLYDHRLMMCNYAAAGAMQDCIKAVTEDPAADVVEVRHGYWFFTEHEYFSCSECGERYYNGCDSTFEAKERLRNGEHHNYCPNCGAKMDGKGER